METYQIIISVIIAGALLIALAAFIKTPPSKRWTTAHPTKEPGVDYAPLYTKQERVRIVLKNLSWALPLALSTKYWLSPHLREYSQHANCYNYGPLNGAQILFYGMFIGVPLCMVLLIYLLEGRSAIRAFKASQYPPPNQKVLQLTPYTYGKSAKLRAVFPFVLIAFCVGLSIWGGFQAWALTENIKPCTAISASKSFAYAHRGSNTGARLLKAE